MEQKQKSQKELKVRCPQCGTRAVWHANPFRPFCSERCKLVDLGKWAEGDYYIPGKPAPDQNQDEDGEH